MSILEEADRLREKADDIGKRGSRHTLYSVLAECYALAVKCEIAPDRRVQLINDLSPKERASPRSRKGQVNGTSSTFQLVARYVFNPHTTKAGRSNASRYGKAMEEAYRRKIGAYEFGRTLRDGGGVAALFLARPLKRQSVNTKVLHLDRSIEAPKGKEFTLTLRRKPNGVFEVMKCE